MNFVDDIAAFNFPWLHFLIALTYRFVPDVKLMDYVCETEQESEVPRLGTLWEKKGDSSRINSFVRPCFTHMLPKVSQFILKGA